MDLNQKCVRIFNANRVLIGQSRAIPIRLVVLATAGQTMTTKAVVVMTLPLLSTPDHSQ